MEEAGTIDSLQIEIEASSKSAVAQINNLANALKRLKAATNGGLNIGNFKKELGKLGGNEYTKIERLAKALQGLKNFKLDDKIGNSMLKIADACELIEQQHIDKLTKFGNALQTIKTVSTKGYDKLPAAILNIADAVDSITDDSIARLSRLTIALSRLRGVDLSGLGTVLRAQNAAHKKLADGTGAASPAVSGKSSTDGESGEDELTQRVRKAAKPATALGSATKAMLHQLANDLKKVASSALSAAKAIGGKFLSAIKSVTSAAIGFGKNILIAPFQALTSRVKALTDKMHNLISSFKRIMFYRVIRTIIKEIGEAMKEGEENAYWYSKTLGTVTHYISEAYDMFASASAMMKNQVGAAWATLFANIEPIITKIVEMVSRAAEVVTMFFAKLGGKNTYLKAINYGKEWAETTEEGSEAAKEWRNQLMGFDEINRLEAPTDSNSGKNKDKTPDYGAMFEEVEVDSAIGDLAERLKELWNNQDWKGLGELIGNTLNDLFPTKEQFAEWGSKLGSWINGAIQTAYYALKAIDFHDWGDRVAAGINAALEQIDFGIWGRLLVRKFTAALDFLLGLLAGLRWDLVGKSIGDFLRGALDEATEWLASYNWGDMSTAMWEKIQALVDGFNVPAFAQRLGDFITTAANSAADFLNGLDFTDVVNTVTSTIATFFDNLGIDNIRTAISNLWQAIQTAFIDTMNAFGEWLRNKDWAEIGESFNATLQNMLDGMLAMVESVPWYDIGHSIGEFLAQIDWLDVLKKFAEGLWAAFSGIISGLWDTNTGKVIVGFIAGFEALKLLFTGVKAFAIFEAIKLFVGGIAGAGGLGALIPALGGVVGGIGTALAPIASVIFSPTGLIIGAVVAATVLIVKNWDDIKEAAGKLKEKLAQDWENLKESASQTWSNIKETVSSKWNELKESASTTWKTIENIISEKWNALKTGAETIWEAVKIVVSSKWDEIKEKASTVWENVKQSVSGAWKTITSNTSTVWSGITGTVSSAWDGIKSIASTAWGGVKDAVTGATSDINTDSKTDTQTLYNDVTGIYNNLHSEAVRVFSDIGRAVPQIMNYLAQEVQNSVQEMSNAMQQMGNDIESAISSISSLEWSIPAPKIPHIDVWYDVVYNGDGSSFEIPQFDVQWYAKGGILKDATLFGMGDAGAEALVPLERNTEWIGKVAAEMNRQSAKNEGRNESNEDVIDALYTICDRIIRAIPDGGEEVDMDSLARALTKVQRRQARAMG